MIANVPIADVEIVIFAPSSEEYEARVVAIDEDGEIRFSLGHLDPDILNWKPSPNVERDRERLSRWLFVQPSARMHWARFAGRNFERRIRIHIDETASELHAVPWELLSEAVEPNSEALATQPTTPFSRYLALERSAGRPILRTPLRVLVAVSNPVDLPDYGLQPIDVKAEWNALTALADNDDVELALFPGGEIVSSSRDIERVLATLGSTCSLSELSNEVKQGYHVLHFIGHGLFDSRSHAMSVIMSDDDNRAAQVDAETFSQIFQTPATVEQTHGEWMLRLVFLATCQSARSDTTPAMRSLALQIVTSDVSAVLAMQGTLPIETNRMFSDHFYRNVLRHGRVDLACNEARAAIARASLPGGDQLPAEAIPALYMRVRDGRLWDFHGFSMIHGQEAPWPRLLTALRRDRCIPIIGPDLGSSLLGTRREIAEQWARSRGYPMAEHLWRDLPQVGQYLSVHDGPDAVRDQLVEHLHARLVDLYPEELADASGDSSPDSMILRVSAAHQSDTIAEAYDILAHLPFSIYVTANPSGMLAHRLTLAGRTPRVDAYEWRLAVEESNTAAASNGQVDRGTDADAIYRPSIECPLVYHMFGQLDDPDSVVLTEDDYFDFLISVGRSRGIPVQPQQGDETVRSALASKMLLFLGFRLEEWSFRVLLRSIVAQEGGFLNKGYNHVAVQINPESYDISDIDRARDYLAQYFGEHRITIYWGKVEYFLRDLEREWKRRTARKVNG